MNRDQVEREIARLEQQANNELDEKKRRQLRSLANDKRDQLRKWERPKGSSDAGQAPG
jgi:hypothetical protein